MHCAALTAGRAQPASGAPAYQRGSMRRSAAAPVLHCRAQHAALVARRVWAAYASAKDAQEFRRGRRKLEEFVLPGHALRAGRLLANSTARRRRRRQRRAPCALPAVIVVATCLHRDAGSAPRRPPVTSVVCSCPIALPSRERRERRETCMHSHAHLELRIPTPVSLMEVSHLQITARCHWCLWTASAFRPLMCEARLPFAHCAPKAKR